MLKRVAVLMVLAVTTHAVQPEAAQLSFDSHSAHTQTLMNGLPIWILGVSQQGGQFIDQPKCWHVDAAQPLGLGRLIVSIDRERMREDIALSVLFEEDEASDLVVQLYDSSDRVIVLDLFANLIVVGREAKTDTFVVPLRKYPAATKIVVRRIKGDIKIYGMALMPVVGEAEAGADTLKELARLLGDPLAPDNPLLKGIAKIAAQSDVPVEWLGGKGSVNSSSTPKTTEITSHPLDAFWEVLPFPKNSDWSGRRGEPSLVGAGELVLQGQPIRYTRVLSTPLTVECDVQLEARAANDGSFDLEFIPRGLPRDTVPRPTTKFRIIYSNTGDYGSVDRLEIDQAGNADVQIPWQQAPFKVDPERMYHLVLKVTASGRLEARIDGRLYTMPSELTVPYETLQIQLLGWQPINHWRVRNFSVH